MIRLICLAIGYVCGLLQTSYFYGRAKGIDIRTKGSGNAGTTNAMRVLGKKAGIITFLGDALKCVAAVLIVQALFGSEYEKIRPLLSIYAGCGVILGHNFPFYLHFKGGKGIAASVGFMLAFGDFRIFLSSILLFFIVLACTHYVSAGSLCIYASFIIQIFLYGRNGDYGLYGAPLYELFAVSAFLTILAFWQHRSNIGRLLAGNENKTYLFGRKK